MDHLTRTKDLLITMKALEQQPVSDSAKEDFSWITHVCSTAVQTWERKPEAGGYIYLASPLSSPSQQLMRMRKLMAWLALEHYTKCCIPAYVPVAINPVIHEHLMSAKTPEETLSHEFWMNICMGFLKGASALHILTLTGWRKSKGVAMEIEEFKKTGRPIIYVAPDSYEQSLDPAEPFIIDQVSRPYFEGANKA